jgi:hypothetical protein
MAGNRRSFIELADVDQIFKEMAINELAKLARLPANSSLSAFADSIRNDARLFIEAKAHLNNPQLRREMGKLYRLIRHAPSDERAQQLARTLEGMPVQIREWLASCNPEGRTIPSSAEITSVEPATRASSVQQLRLILSYGADVVKKGRKRPSGKRSRSLRPLLRVHAIRPKSGRKPNEGRTYKEGRPRGDAERAFVRNLGLTYAAATGKRPPYKVDFQGRGPFSKFVHRCFELVGAPGGHVTKLINELGQARREAANREIEYPQDFNAHLNEREQFYKQMWRAEAQQKRK